MSRRGIISSISIWASGRSTRGLLADNCVFNFLFSRLNPSRILSSRPACKTSGILGLLLQARFLSFYLMSGKIGFSWLWRLGIDCVLFIEPFVTKGSCSWSPNGLSESSSLRDSDVWIVESPSLTEFSSCMWSMISLYLLMYIWPNLSAVFFIWSKICLFEPYFRAWLPWIDASALQ